MVASLNVEILPGAAPVGIKNVGSVNVLHSLLTLSDRALCVPLTPIIYVFMEQLLHALSCLRNGIMWLVSGVIGHFL